MIGGLGTNKKANSLANWKFATWHIEGIELVAT